MLLLLEEATFGDDTVSTPNPEMHKPSIVGCMTTACHGSNLPDAKTWQRAGKIWFDLDPHAHAYTSLLTEASERIVSKLVGEEWKASSQSYRDFLNAKCVSCHANENAPETQRVLGADCQVCHGSADAWGSQHYSSEWKALGRNRFDDTQMSNVESFLSRAKICSSCHIGELNRTNGSSVGLDREVDHRMMAAGHPPMHFDFEVYSRRYPVHWDTTEETIGLGSPIGLERWRTGKITAAITKLNQLAARADRSTGQSANTNDWPELTEYSCTSCHHSLKQPSWRPARGAKAIADWDDWCISQLDCAIREPSVGELDSQFRLLKSQMEKIAPEPRIVMLTAKSLCRMLEMELDHASAPIENGADVMLRKLKSRVNNVTGIRNWESATQWYIATRVLCEGLGIECIQLPVPFVKEDPFSGSEKTWKRSSSKDFKSPTLFHPDMLTDYHRALMQQLRARP